MGRNRVLDDADHIPTDSKDLNLSKAPLPRPWPIPDFEPREINNPLTHSQGNLPENVRPDDPYTIFSLFFNDFILRILVTNINKFAELNPAPETPHARSWRSMTIIELRAYIGVYIWMGVHHESSLEKY